MFLSGLVGPYGDDVGRTVHGSNSNQEWLCFRSARGVMAVIWVTFRQRIRTSFTEVGGGALLDGPWASSDRLKAATSSVWNPPAVVDGGVLFLIRLLLV